MPPAEAAAGAPPGGGLSRLRDAARRADGLAERVPGIALGLVVSILTWSVTSGLPSTGLDSSWIAGLYIAVHDGIRFGPDFVFNYGPLGFLNFAVNWYQGLSTLAYLWLALLHVVLACQLVIALRRSVGTIGAVVIAFLVLAQLEDPLDTPFAVAAFLSFAVLRPDPPRFGLESLIVGGALLAATQCLIKLSVGPVLFAMCLLALIGARARPWQVGAFLAVFVGSMVGLWLASGQELGDFADYITNGSQIVSGYSEAMAATDLPDGTSGLLLAAAVLGAAGLAVGAWWAGYRDRFARYGGVAIAAGVGFALFKAGVVRFDLGHISAFFATVLAVWLALPWGPSRRLLMLGGLAAYAVVALAVQLNSNPGSFWTNLDVSRNVNDSYDQTKLAFSPSLGESVRLVTRTSMIDAFGIDERMLAQLEGQRVEVQPWEISAVWAYGLDWSPTPVIQGYQANTSDLDRLNAERIESPDGPTRILRHDPAIAGSRFRTRTIDGRFQGWDPPGQTFATFCNFEILQTTPRWQLLGRIPDRCGEPRPAGTVDASYGETVEVPQPGPGEVMMVRIEGAGVGGFERIRSFLYKARYRYVTINGEGRYRLVPGTAGDGLPLSGPPGVVGEGIFQQAPQAETIELSGAGGDLRYDFYAVPIEPTPTERAGAR